MQKQENILEIYQQFIFAPFKYPTTTTLLLTAPGHIMFIKGQGECGGKKWKHLGFVTKAYNKRVKTNGVTYYDFKVAQHSKEYHRKVSHKNNGGETLKKSYPNIRYAIIY